MNRRPEGLTVVPRTWQRIKLRLRSLLRLHDVEADVRDELEFHIEEHTALLMRRGLSHAAARREAMLQFGGVERRKEEVRDARGVAGIENLLRDLRYALRGLRRAPVYAVVAILTLALGIGANTAIFTVVNAVLLRPLAYQDPSRLVIFAQGGGTAASPANFLDWRAQSHVFERVGAAEDWSPSLTGDNRPEVITAQRVTSDILPLLGVQPLLGRMFLPDEEHNGNNHVAILRHDFWQNRYAADPAIVGRSIKLNGESYTVVGVMPKDFRFTPVGATEAVLWSPLPLDARQTVRERSSLNIFARLKPGITIAQARADVGTVAARLESQFPGTNKSVTVTPLQEIVSGSVKPALLILLAAVGLVLLIACANVAHLQLIRASAREREFALRGALGASRSRLLQQSLVESAVLSLTGGVLGLALAAIGVRALVALAPPSLPRMDAVQLDWYVFGYLLLVAIIAGVVFGVGPALATARATTQGTLKEGRVVGDSPRRRRLRAALVVSEFAMALMLLLGAGLVLRSFVALLNVSPGFDPKQTLSMVVSVGGSPSEAAGPRENFFTQVIERTQQIAGVEGVSAINHLPLHGAHWQFHYFVEGEQLPEPGAGPQAQFLVIRPNYFQTIRATLISGRDFTRDDITQSQKVVIINDVMAQRAWPNTNALGKRIDLNGKAPQDWYTVVGVVKDIRQASWSGDPVGEMYFPNSAAPEGAVGIATALNQPTMTLVVRSSIDPAGLTRSVRETIQGLEREATVSDVISLEGAIGEQLATPKFYLFLLGLFAVVATALAAIGSFGVISYSVARRSHEIGVRLALGADRAATFRMVVRQGVMLALIGGVIGLAGAFAATRFLSSMLYGIEPIDPLTFAAGFGLMIVIGVVASAIPARRASGLDPVRVLRAE